MSSVTVPDCAACVEKSVGIQDDAGRDRADDSGDVPIFSVWTTRPARKIKTFTEGTDPDASDIVAIRKWLSAAELVLFLGFAFHRLNLNLLKPSDAPDRGPDRVDYFGTAKGISSSDCAAVREDLIALASAKPDRIVLRNDLTCAQLLREYWRTLSIV